MSDNPSMSNDDGVVVRLTRTRWFRGVAAAGALAVAISYLFHPTVYRIDLEIYRAGGRAWLDGVPLYTQAFPTRIGNPLEFTYPPISAIVFGPLAWMPLEAANAVWAVLTLVLLALTLAVVLQIVGVPARTRAWWWLLVASFALTARLEPVRATMGYGQINVVLMAMVVADCLLVRTPWPRGALVGIVAALKLTPAVFVLYFLVRRDYRAAATAAITGALVTGLGFALAPSDSVEYWFRALRDTDRIGQLTYTSNQNLQGLIARAGVVGTPATLAWAALSVAVLAVGWVAMRQANRAGIAALTLTGNGLIGLLISPVSWSHHWVWVAPAVVVLTAVALACRSYGAAALAVSGIVIFAIAPHWRLPQDNTSGVEITWAVWQKAVGNSYVWWALAVLVVCAVAARRWRVPAQVMDRSTNPKAAV